MTVDTPKPSQQIPKRADEAATSLNSDDQLAAELRRFGPLGIIALLLVLLIGNIFVGNIGGIGVAVPVGAVLVLVWARLSRTPWREIGYVRPRSWTVSLIVGIAFGVAFKFVMKALVMPLFGAAPVNPAYHFLAGNRAALPVAAWAMLVAGFGEETVFRGYMFERLGKLLGPGRSAKIAIVLITSTLFGLAHYVGQGLTGVEQAILTGLIFGTIFAFSGRLFMLMCAHAAFDLAALAMIYWNLETRVAHLIFR